MDNQTASLREGDPLEIAMDQSHPISVPPLPTDQKEEVEQILERLDGNRSEGNLPLGSKRPLQQNISEDVDDQYGGEQDKK